MIRTVLLLAAAGFIGVLSPALADVTPASLFGDNMVLQRGAPVPVWGTALPGEAVSVRFGGQIARTITDPGGKWKITLRKMRAIAQPGEMTVVGKNTVKFSNVLVGEVWICSGQSNMEFALYGAKNAAAEIAAANYPAIRMFTVAKNPMPTPQESCGGSWAVCEPRSAGSFSAVGYFFARQLYEKLHVPVGMIHTSWGGTPAQTWTPLATLKSLPALRSQAVQFESDVNTYLAHKEDFAQQQAAGLAAYQARRQAWYNDIDARDKGITEHWMDPAFAPANWTAFDNPVAPLNNVLHQYLGVMWQRKTVKIPESWVGKDLNLHVGAIDEADDTYVNGQKVGRTWFEVPNYWMVPRVYKIPGALVTSPDLSLTVRILNLYGDLGMTGPASEMYVRPVGMPDEKPVSLAGSWIYANSLAFNPGEAPQPPASGIPGTQPGSPATLYNGMIAPLIPYAIRGAIWYQGEANAGEPLIYRDLFPAMITSWRRAWGEGDFHFAFVQLANFMTQQTAPIEPGSWAEIREAQMAALRLPHTSAAVIIDIGEGPDIHPKNKQDVGKRLALPVLKDLFHLKGEDYGPVYRSVQVRGDRAIVRFDHSGDMQAHGKQLLGFAIAGADKVFHTGTATIQGNRVLVSSAAVKHPVAVRYGWANNPVCNLYNGAGLPASPFRTDDWLQGDVRAAAETVPAP